MGGATGGPPASQQPQTGWGPQTYQAPLSRGRMRPTAAGRAWAPSEAPGWARLGGEGQARASFLLARPLRLFFSPRLLLNFPSSWINKQQVPTSTKQEPKRPHKSSFQQRQAPLAHPGLRVATAPRQGWGGVGGHADATPLPSSSPTPTPEPPPQMPALPLWDSHAGHLFRSPPTPSRAHACPTTLTALRADRVKPSLP